MKNFIIVGIVVLVGFFIVLGLRNVFLSGKKVSTTNQTLSPTSTPDNTAHKPTSFSLFFPSWTLPETSDPISLPQITTIGSAPIADYIYFGVAPGIDGHLDKTDQGYKNLSKFLSHPQIAQGKKLLTLRMVNDTINSELLEDPSKQERALYDTVTLAKDYGFVGIVVDLEVKALPTDKTINQIVNFVKRADIIAKANNLSLGITLYGDVFYRARPYDVGKLAPLVDQMYIMAYDFHKPAGQPGPNFPAGGADKFGYDLTLLADEITQQAPPEKITVVFGMFGYDWVVDEKRRPFKPAVAKTLAQVIKEYIETCKLKNCAQRRDTTSSETEITFFHEYPNFHDIWYEDEKSVEFKIGVVSAKNITRFAFWGYGYY